MRKSEKQISTSYCAFSKNLKSPQSESFIRSPQQRTSLKSIVVDLHFPKSEYRNQAPQPYAATKLVPSSSFYTRNNSQSMIKDSQFERKFEAVTTENQKLAKERTALFAKNCELQKMISALRNKHGNPQHQQLLEDAHDVPQLTKQTRQRPVSSLPGSMPQVNFAKIKKQSESRERGKFQKFGSKDSHHQAVISPRVADCFDQELEELRLKKMKLLSDLNETRALNQKHSKGNFIDLSDQFEEEKSLRESIKTIQTTPNYISASNCCKRKEHKYVIIQCCDCGNCSSEHLPSVDNFDFQRQTVFHRDKTPQTNNYLQIPKESKHIKKTRKQQFEAIKETPLKKYLTPSLKSFPLYEKSPKNTTVNDLSKKIQQLRAQNQKLRGEFFH